MYGPTWNDATVPSVMFAALVPHLPLLSKALLLVLLFHFKAMLLRVRLLSFKTLMQQVLLLLLVALMLPALLRRPSFGLWR